MTMEPTPDVEGLDVLERIGGTRAHVHRAVVRSSGRVVVVKHAGATDTTTRAGLRREAAVLGRVRHPTLQQLLDVHDDERGTSLVLARHVGGDLAAHLHGRGPLDTTTVAALGARVARALAALHAADVLHRDVRAANVLLDAGGRAVLADLDHALDPSSPPLAVDREVVGERSHLDPRLLAGAPADEASDLHALGVMLWAAVTGGLPRGRPGTPGASPAAAGTTAPGGPGLLEVLHDLLEDGASDARAVADRLAELAGDRPGVLPVPRATPVPTGDAGTRTGATAPDADGTPGPTASGSDHAAESGQDGLAAAWQGDAGTERFGSPGVPVVERLRRRLPRWHVLAAVVGLALVPLVAVVAGDTGVARGPDETPVATATGRPVDPADQPGPTPDGLAPRTGGAEVGPPVTPPPPCPGVAPPPGALLADLDGSGCGRVLLHDEEAARLTTDDGRGWALGQPGDVLLVGDWDGDGRWSPGLHRPGTGEVFLFPPLGDEEVTSAPVQRWPAGGEAVVVDVDGHHGVVVRPDPE